MVKGFLRAKQKLSNTIGVHSIVRYSYYSDSEILKCSE